MLVPWLLGWPGSGLAFNVALQLGTLIAVLVYFWHDLLSIVVGSVRGVFTRRPEDEKHVRLGAALVVGSVPAAMVGLLLEEPIEHLFHVGQLSEASLLAIAAGLFVMGLALLWAERIGSKTRVASSLGMGQVLLIGVAQSLALMPGVSRSGSTITAGLLLGLQRAEAARFSFLLAVPITIGAGLLEAVQLIQSGGLRREEWTAFAVGIISAAVVGYLSIWFLLFFLQNHSNRPFAAYRVGLAVIVVVLVLGGWPTA